jgi:hypothetical protein
MSLHRSILTLLSAAVLSAPVAVAAPLTPSPSALVTEHVDINVLFSGGQWDVQLRDDDNQVAFPSGQAFVHVDASAETLRSASSSFDFVGVGPGEPYYRITASQTPGLVYLGNAAYGVSSSAVDLYNANTESGGRVNGNGRWVRLNLHSVDGPGHYSAWSNSLGGPVRFFSTAQSGTAPSETDTLWLVAGGHSHFNHGFTRRGLYRVNYLPAAYLNDNNSATLGPNSQASEPIGVYFNVDPGYAVSGLSAASALPRVGEVQFLGGFRSVSVGGATSGSVRIGELFPNRAYVLIDLASPDDLNALRLALGGFPQGPDYDLPAVPPTATIDDSVLVNYPGFDLALRFDGLPGSTFDFEFDYSMILDGVAVNQIGVLGTVIAVPEPGGIVLGLVGMAACCGRWRRRR